MIFILMVASFQIHHLCNYFVILYKKIHVTNYQDMSSYGALMMGLLGMNIITNFKDMKKLKQKYLVFPQSKIKVVLAIKTGNIF